MNILNPRIVIEKTGFIRRLFKNEYKVYLKYSIETHDFYTRFCNTKTSETKYFGSDKIYELKEHIEFINSRISGADVTLINLPNINL